MGLPAICLMMACLRVAAQPASRCLSPDHPATWYSTQAGNVERAGVLGRLDRMQGRQLVLVRYAPGHNWFAEWVYSRADIDAAKVVWAHEMDEAHNRRHISYRGARSGWSSRTPSPRDSRRTPRGSSDSPLTAC